MTTPAPQFLAILAETACAVGIDDALRSLPAEDCQRAMQALGVAVGARHDVRRAWVSMGGWSEARYAVVVIECPDGVFVDVPVHTLKEYLHSM